MFFKNIFSSFYKILDFFFKNRESKVDLSSPNINRRCMFLIILGSTPVLLVSMLGHLTGYYLSEGNYTPFSVGGGVSVDVFDQTYLYLPSVTKFFKFLSLASETDNYELRSWMNSYPFFHSVIIGIFSRIVGGTELGWMISQSIFTWCTWMAVAMIMAIFRKPLAICFLASWCVFCFAFGPRNFIGLGSGYGIQPLEILRTPHPSLSFLILLLALAAIAISINKCSRKSIFISSILLGSTAYCYYFSLVAAFGTCILLFLIGLAVRNRKLYQPSGAIFLIGFLTSIPFFYRTFHGFVSGQSSVLVARQSSSGYEISVLGIILLVVAGGLILRHIKQKQFLKSMPNILMFVLLAAIFVAAAGMNLHFVTGVNLQHELHFRNRILQPMVLILFFAMLGNNFLKIRYIQKILYGMTVLLIVVAVHRQIIVAQNITSNHRTDTPEFRVLKWLEIKVDRNTVVGSIDLDFILLLPGVAGSWTYVPASWRTMTLSADIFSRYIRLGTFLGLTKTQLERRLFEERKLISTHFQTASGLIARVKNDRQIFEQQWKLASVSNKALGRLDFVIARSDSPIDSANVTVVHRENPYVIYRLKANRL